MGGCLPGSQAGGEVPRVTAQDQKRAAGEAAARLVEDGMVVGLGTGSTAAWFVRALAMLSPAVRCVATSQETADLAASLGLQMVAPEDVSAIDLTVDGADEIGPRLALIKGGGAALLREKLVWLASVRRVVIADSSKLVECLGAYPLPVEVVSFAHRWTAKRIAAAVALAGIEAEPVLRVRGGAPLVTDGGGLIYDLACGAIRDPAELAAVLKGVSGVVDHGLFLGLAERALVGRDFGVDTLRP